MSTRFGEDKRPCPECNQSFTEKDLRAHLPSAHGYVPRQVWRAIEEAFDD